MNYFVPGTSNIYIIKSCEKVKAEVGIFLDFKPTFFIKKIIKMENREFKTRIICLE